MFLCHSISIKHKYEVTNQKNISFNYQIFLTIQVTLLTDVLTAKEANRQKYTKKIQYSTFADINFSDFSNSLQKKGAIYEEDLHGIEIDGILNLENLSRTVFID